MAQGHMRRDLLWIAAVSGAAVPLTITGAAAPAFADDPSEAGGVVTAADGGPLAPSPAVGSGDGYGVAVLASASQALHERLLDAIALGMTRLQNHVAGGGPVH